jgi:trimethylamine--corrinoid protein Co-methyltransferase
LRLLTRVGIRVESEEARDLFADNGIRVDPLLERVYPRQEDVANALSTAPSTFKVYGRGSHPLVIGGDGVFILSGGASIRVLTLDGAYEEASWEHLRQFNLLLDALPNVHMLLNQVDPQPPCNGYYRRIAAEMLCGTGKSCCLQAGDAADVAAFVEMGAAIRGSREALAAKPIFITGSNAEPPLCLPAHAAEILIEASRNGVPCGVGDYVMMGITAPITPAGALVQRNAVQLAALILSQLAQPGAAFYYVGSSGSADMRTLDPITADPASARLLRDATALGRSYGLPVCGLACTDAKSPDPQAACERTALLQIAMGAGAHLIQGPTSMMDGMMLSSFTQAIIDHDIVSYLLAAQQPTAASIDMLAMSAIREVAEDVSPQNLKFVAHPHTAEHLHDAEWQPAVFSSAPFSAARRLAPLLERAESVARTILLTHQPESLPPDVEGAIRKLAIVTAP